MTFSSCFYFNLNIFTYCQTKEVSSSQSDNTVKGFQICSSIFLVLSGYMSGNTNSKFTVALALPFLIKSALEVKFYGFCTSVEIGLSVSSIFGIGTQVQWPMLHLRYLRVYAQYLHSNNPYIIHGYDGNKGYPVEFVFDVLQLLHAKSKSCHINAELKYSRHEVRTHMAPPLFPKKRPSAFSDDIIYRNRVHYINHLTTSTYSLSWNDVFEVCHKSTGSIPFLYLTESELQYVTEFIFSHFRKLKPVLVFTGHTRQFQVSSFEHAM